MEELLSTISVEFDAFKADSAKAAKGNAAAGVRARKCSLSIEKHLKEFRKESVK